MQTLSFKFSIPYDTKGQRNNIKKIAKLLISFTLACGSRPNQGILTFTDPISGDNYYMSNLQVLIDYGEKDIEDEKILCSRFGWLLFYHKDFECLGLFNPFTNEFHRIPLARFQLLTACFSAPPTSPDCMIVGFSSRADDHWHVSIYLVARGSPSRTLSMGADPHTIRFPTFKDGDLYALGNEGYLIVFKDLGKEDYSRKLFEAKAPISCCKSLAKYFLMTTCDHDILLVVGEFGEFVEVFKWNDATKEWEKIVSLGRLTIFIGGTCICIEAKIPEMENKIYFPRLHSKNGKMVFYSLETCMYHTSTSKFIEESLKDFIGTDCHLNSHAWIEPSWS